MTRDDFIAKYKHELGGMVAEAATTKRTGGELGLMIYNDFARIHKMLGEMYDLLHPPNPKAPPGPTSGPAAPARK